MEHTLMELVIIIQTMVIIMVTHPMMHLRMEADFIIKEAFLILILIETSQV